jgi:hypothetical protein
MNETQKQVDEVIRYVILENGLEIRKFTPDLLKTEHILATIYCKLKEAHQKDDGVVMDEFGTIDDPNGVIKEALKEQGFYK